MSVFLASLALQKEVESLTRDQWEARKQSEKDRATLLSQMRVLESELEDQLVQHRGCAQLTEEVTTLKQQLAALDKHLRSQRQFMDVRSFVCLFTSLSQPRAWIASVPSCCRLVCSTHFNGFVALTGVGAWRPACILEDESELSWHLLVPYSFLWNWEKFLAVQLHSCISLFVQRPKLSSSSFKIP